MSFGAFRCVCINLDRRPDRWAAFCDRLPKDWPFPYPERFSAFDGKDSLIIPPGWLATPGAFGCLLSHRVLLRETAERNQTILILEDDVIFRPNFSEQARLFVENVLDWDMLYFGGQHLPDFHSLPTEHSNVRKCVKTQRTHAYAITPGAAERLLPLAEATDSHIDVLYARAQYDGLVKAYAAHPWLCGQTAGTSDVFGTKQQARTVDNFWNEVA
jgi:GR25 family glycosyltransferase involved in LPS biosynthesis